MNSDGEVLRLVTQIISFQYKSPLYSILTFHSWKMRVFWMWNCGIEWLGLHSYSSWTVWLLQITCCSHLKCQQLLAQWHSYTSPLLWEPQISHSKAFPNFGNFSVSYLSTVLPQRFLTILLHCTTHNHYLISVTICNSRIQLGPTVESDRALPTCGALLLQLKSPFST